MTLAFVAGYLLAWSAAGLVAYALIEGVRSLDLGFLAWDQAGRYVAGGAILAAALFQLTPRQGRVPAPLPRPARGAQRARARRHIASRAAGR